jgi:hypothetical protein
MGRPLKAARNDIRQRYKETPEIVIAEFKAAMADKDRGTRRLYWTGLNKLLFDLANKDNDISSNTKRL